MKNEQYNGQNCEKEGVKFHDDLVYLFYFVKCNELLTEKSGNISTRSSSATRTTLWSKWQRPTDLKRPQLPHLIVCAITSCYSVTPQGWRENQTRFKESCVSSSYSVSDSGPKHTKERLGLILAVGCRSVLCRDATDLQKAKHTRTHWAVVNVCIYCRHKKSGGRRLMSGNFIKSNSKPFPFFTHNKNINKSSSNENDCLTTWDLEHLKKKEYLVCLLRSVALKIILSKLLLKYSMLKKLIEKERGCVIPI